MTTATAPQQLIAENQGLVKSLALKIHRQLGQSTDLDELISDGQIGLAQAARDFDPQRGVKFSTFAYYRIRGAIFDGLSRTVWSKRLPAADFRFEQLADKVLQAQLLQPADPPEENLESAAGWLNSVTARLAVVYMMSQGGTADAPFPEMADPATPPPDAAAADREIVSRLSGLVDQLPGELAGLIRAVYFEGLTLQEAGRRLGFSKSWASRLHTRALDLLSHALRRLGVEG